MKESDLTPRVLAGLVLGESPETFLVFRTVENPDGRYSCVVVDQAGRKFVLSQADLERERERVITSRLQARGRALVEEIKTLPEAPSPAPAARPVPKAAPLPAAAPSRAAAKSPSPKPRPAAKKAQKPT
jgi:hypothetical protein